ncbi:MAG: creatininase family protein, partial [Candidatus Bathyarchaeota archaeon]|nr:creatininase family protein [Candidatus Bathyarchaeota archaeon]
MLDARNTSKEISESQPEVAVFGIGAIEQHSIHLPLGTDWLGVSDITHRVAKEMDAFLVPALPFSMSECHGPMAGTVWLRPETLAAVVRDTVLSLYEQGFRRVLIVNGHGGNFVLEAEIRRLNLNHPDLIVLIPPFLPPRPGEPKIWDKGVGIHASESETSHQLYINREHVKDERIDYMPPVGREFLDYAYMGFISEWGVWGYPSYGTVEKGEKATTRRVERIVEWAREAFSVVESLRAHGGEG